MTREPQDHGIRFCIVCVLAVWGGLLFSFESRAQGPMDNALALFLSVCFLIFYLPIPLLAQVLFIFNTPNCRRIAWVLLRMWLPLTVGFLLWAHFTSPQDHLSTGPYCLGPIAISLIVLVLSGCYYFIARGIDRLKNAGAPAKHKAPKDMTLEELWQLFPIILTEHREEWALWYAEERDRLAALLPQQVRIHHIGSTAIRGIWAKPIIDILVEIPTELSMEPMRAALLRAGYTCMSEEAGRLSFNRGYTPEGFAERVYHLHLRYAGDNDELYFRDYMNTHPALAKEYEALKLTLRKQHEHNRDAYTAAKTTFITTHTAAAKSAL